MPKSVSAIVVATPTADHHFDGVAPGGRKSLVPVIGRPAISHLADALNSSELVSRVVVVGDQAVLDAVPSAEGVSAASTEAGSVVAGVRASEEAEWCLVMSGDMPLVTAEAVDDLLTSAPESDVVYPITSQQDMEDLYPSRKTGYLRVKEGHYAGSSCLLVRGNVALRKEKQLAQVLEARRSPAALLSLVGPWTAVKLMAGAMSLRDLERFLSDALGLDCRVFITHYPELLFSLDTPEDVSTAREQLEGA